MKKNCAVIVETRQLENIVDIVEEKHLKFIPKSFDFFFYCSKNNIEFLREKFKHNLRVNFFIMQEEIQTENDYNKLLTSESFWLTLNDYERVLIFQHDSEILRLGIEPFLQFDYVGAPWKFQNHGGNGGLSIRNPKAMIETIKRKPYRGQVLDGNEDVYFSNNLEVLGIAPREVCELFSCESIFKKGTFGVHAIDKWLTPLQSSILKIQYKNQ
jgi:hypothetical protein